MMPRRGRHTDRRPGPTPGTMGQILPPDNNAENPRRDRTQVFEKTKMCKFFIMGCCSRSDNCQFAHDKEDLSSAPNLFRTKLCKSLINTGNCSDANCRYAHSRDELRIVDGFNTGETAAATPNALPSAHKAPPAPTGGRQAHGGGPSSVESYGQSSASQQMQQAAQAHAAEAVRLQAMAACLQQAAQAQSVAAGAMGGGMWGAPWPGAAMQGATGSVQWGTPAVNMQPWAPNPAAPPNRADAQRSPPAQHQPVPSGRHPNMAVKNTFISVDNDSTPSNQQARFPRVKTAGARLESMVGDADTTPQASAAASNAAPGTGYNASDPVQIPLASLRSMSSQSLPISAYTEEEEQEVFGQDPGYINQGASAQSNTDPLQAQVKNTFLHFDQGNNTLNRSLRPISSAQGRLDALAEGANSPSPGGLGGVVEESPSNSPAARNDRTGDGGAGGAFGTNLLPETKSIKVRNTFLDFGDEETPLGLRAVHTAAGRLDLLGGDD